MCIVSLEASNKKSSANALKIGAEAKKAKEVSKDVINSTIGMLYDEDGKFFTFKSVKMALDELNDQQKYSYISTEGLKEFHEVLYKWIFQDKLDEIKKNMYLKTIATPGGTGAICNTFSNYLEKGQKVLLPSLMWTNYIQIAQEQGLLYDTYDLFDENGKFNIASFKAKVKELVKTQKRCLVVINDPCHNPTGYSMTHDEWKKVIEVINDSSNDNNPIILLHDMAYIDYDIEGFIKTRNNLSLLQQLNKNVLAILAFSGSKTMGLYGLRVGAQIALSKSSSVIEEFKIANEYSARSMWSLTSTLGQNIVVYVLTKYKESFTLELQFARELLIKRAKAFIKEAFSVGLRYYPYDCGFFVTIPTKDPKEMYEKLKEKGLYTIPLEQGIRLTLSSITVDEVKRAVHILKNTLDNN